MATTLINRRMHPDLAARIERSLKRSGTSVGRGIYRHNTVASFRVAVGLAIVVAILMSFMKLRRERASFEGKRAALLVSIAAEASTLSTEQRGMVARTRSLLQRSAGAYEGDLVSAELARLGLDAVLARPITFARAATADLGRPGARDPSSSGLEAVGDAFLSCLLEPPKAHEDTESALLARFRDRGGPPSRAAGVPLLKDAEAGLPALSAEFEERVRSARSTRELARLQSEFERAPITAARQAAKAAVLIAVLDEPDEGSGFSELEGELPHYGRVVLVDLESSSVLLRARKRLDPSWIQKSRRPKYAKDFDGCKLAIEVREGLRR